MSYESDPSLLEAVQNEIALMQKLASLGPSVTDFIIRLIAAEVIASEQRVLIVMEYGEIDLAHILQVRVRVTVRLGLGLALGLG